MNDKKNEHENEKRMLYFIFKDILLIFIHYFIYLFLLFIILVTKTCVYG